MGYLGATKASRIWFLATRRRAHQRSLHGRAGLESRGFQLCGSSLSDLLALYVNLSLLCWLGHHSFCRGDGTFGLLADLLRPGAAVCAENRVLWRIALHPRAVLHFL